MNNQKTKLANKDGNGAKKEKVPSLEGKFESIINGVPEELQKLIGECYHCYVGDSTYAARGSKLGANFLT